MQALTWRIGLLIWISLTTNAWCQQAINVDLGISSMAQGPAAGPPMALDFCGAAGVPGTWHNVTSMPPTGCMGTCYPLGPNVTLTRTSGAGLPANLGTAAPMGCGPPGDFAKLMCDFQDLTLADPMFGTVTYAFDGLSPGRYRVYTYAIHPLNSDVRTTITVCTVDPNGVCVGSTSGVQEVGGPLPMPMNSFMSGITHAEHDIVVAPGPGGITGPLKVTAHGGAVGGVVNGFQIVPRRIYVDAAASGANNGTSWLNAYTDLQCALGEAASMAVPPVDVWVAAGVYHPAPAGGDRAASFELLTNVGIFGGFGGAGSVNFPCGEAQLADRDPPLNVTTLSGDLNNDDGPGFANNGENSFHVVHSAPMTGPTAVLDGFTISAGNANGDPTGGHDGGGGFRQDGGAPTIRNCRFEGNACTGNGGGVFCNSGVLNLAACTIAGNNAGSAAGGIHLAGAMGVFDGVVLEANTAPSADAGFMGISTANLMGDLLITSGSFEVHDTEIDAAGGPGHIVLGTSGELAIAGLIPNAEATVTRANIFGSGHVFVEAGEALVLENGAVIDLSGANVLGECTGMADPAQSAGWGTVTLYGNLLVPNGTVQFCNIEVKNNASSMSCGNAVGGRVVAPEDPNNPGTATVHCNVVEAEGDRYFVTSPLLAPPNLFNNYVTLMITPDPGAPGSDEQGELLEVRDFDHDVGPDPMNPQHPCPEQDPCVVQLESESLGFSGPWALQKLVLQPGARLNLTNRANDPAPEDPGLPFPSSDVLYVRDLVLGTGAVLNSSLQRMYYQTLHDEDGNPLEPSNPNDPNPTEFTNGSRIVSVPLLGFALEVIELDDLCEFTVRVHTATSNGSSISLVDGEPVIPGVGGVMDLHCGSDAAPFAAASGAFAPVLENEVTVAFDYLFTAYPSDAPDAELRVYLRDIPVPDPFTCNMDCCDQNVCEVARISPPETGQAGSFGSMQFARFYGVFPRGLLDLSGGTYVELRLLGANARVWIDKWDPMVGCSSQCADLNGDSGVSPHDYLLALATYGLDLSVTPFQFNVGCVEFTGAKDHYIDLSDVLAWDARLNFVDPNAPPATVCTVSVTPPSGMGIGVTLPGGSLVVAGKSNSSAGAAGQNDRLYSFDTDGKSVGPSRVPASAPGPQAQQRGNGRLVKDASGALYQVHAAQGLVRLTDAVAVVPPSPAGGLPFGDALVHVGVDPISDCNGNTIIVPLADAAFAPNVGGIVYVAPVLVATPGTTPHRAAAKLAIDGMGGYTVEALYEPPSNTTITGCGTIPSPDLRNLREIEVSRDGTRIYLAAAQAYNFNDWVMSFDEAVGSTPLQSLELGGSSPELLNGMTLKSPTALLASVVSDRLYLTASVNELPDHKTRVFRFDTVPDLTFVGVVDIANDALCTNPYTAFGCSATITSLCEDAAGNVYGAGAMLPIFDPPDAVSAADLYSPMLPPFGGTNPGPIFTTATLATIPATAGWSATPPAIPAVSASRLCVADLTLPISMLFNTLGTPGSPGDFDGSGRTDLRDFAGLQSCFSAASPTASCAFFNRDCDADVGLDDYAAFAAALVGP